MGVQPWRHGVPGTHQAPATCHLPPATWTNGARSLLAVGGGKDGWRWRCKVSMHNPNLQVLLIDVNPYVHTPRRCSALCFSPFVCWTSIYLSMYTRAGDIARRTSAGTPPPFSLFIHIRTRFLFDYQTNHDGVRSVWLGRHGFRDAKITLLCISRTEPISFITTHRGVWLKQARARRQPRFRVAQTSLAVWQKLLGGVIRI